MFRHMKKKVQKTPKKKQLKLIYQQNLHNDDRLIV